MYPNQPMYGMPGFGFRNQPMYQQPSQPAPQQSVVTMVTSKAQAEVAQIPFDGQPYFFYNTSTRELYGKAFDPQTGNCPLIDYAPVTQAPPPQYATVDMLDALTRRVEEMSAMITPRKATRKEADAE